MSLQMSRSQMQKPPAPRLAIGLPDASTVLGQLSLANESIAQRNSKSDYIK